MQQDGHRLCVHTWSFYMKGLSTCDLSICRGRGPNPPWILRDDYVRPTCCKLDTSQETGEPLRTRWRGRGFCGGSSWLPTWQDLESPWIQTLVGRPALNDGYCPRLSIRTCCSHLPNCGWKEARCSKLLQPCFSHHDGLCPSNWKPT